ncbi:nucleoplasmin-like protein ANO39 [Solenopsis invicta]|uniref:nucleoplasmin-like protein ANO39 n=1 Tax=Solenopsis invicta TaxID=13686 RepID=UPI00059629AE|nr:nucleoplasmin-like protein ANO39 [Solenopsis invicta]
MKKIKDYSDEDDYEVDDPDYPEVEGASEEEWTPEAGTEAGSKIRPQRGMAKKRQHSEEEDEEEEEEEEEDEFEEDEESDSDGGKKSKRKRRSKKEDDEKEDEEEEDSDDNSYNESGETPKEYTSGSFVLAKADLESNKNKEDNLSSKGKSDVESSAYPTLWRIDGKALLQKFLPFEEDGKVLYKSTTTYSGWQQSNKDNYIAVQVSFKVQSRQETIVELHFDPSQQQEVVKDDKED